MFRRDNAVPNQIHRHSFHRRNNQTRPVFEHFSKHHHCLIQKNLITVPVSIKFNKFVNTYALLDMGNSCSYLQKGIAEQLQVPFHQKSEKLLIGGFHQSLQTLAHPVNFKMHPFGNNNEVSIFITFLLWIILISIQLNHKHSTRFVSNSNILKTSAFRFYPTTQLQ